MRTLVVGDVHGCLEELENLLETVGYEPTNDRLFFAGDLMDRGPYPVECVQFVRSLGVQMALGNHEEVHLRWRRHEERRAADPRYENPMRMLPERQAQNALLTAEDVAWLRACPVTLELAPGWLLVHGGLFPGMTVEEQVADKDLRDKIVRLRWLADGTEKYVRLENDTAPTGPSGTHPWMEAYDGPYNVVYGHAVYSLMTPRIDERPQGVKTYGIDTGCVFGGLLTAMVIEGDFIDFVQVPAQKAYAKRRGMPE